MPAIGYGIRYEFGIFDQQIRDGWQVEVTDKWLQKGNPWELVRPEISFYVNFGGHTETYTDEQGRYRVRWRPAREVKGVACDTPVLGYRVNTCNTLRLWKSEAVESFDFQDFNVGDYYGAVQEKVISETLSKVLYPNDEPEIGKRLRLAQQYFFVSCSLQDMLRLLDLKGEPIERFADLFAAQLNDTHPSIAVAELMRLLVDERSSALGTGMGHHAAHARLHQPHAVARGARNLGPAAVPQPAAAPARDHLRDQSPLPRRGAAPLSRRRRARRAPVADR